MIHPIAMCIHKGKGKGYIMQRLGMHRREGEVQLQTLRNPGLEESGWSAPYSGQFSPGKDPVSFVQEAGWTSGLA
jgi:hypothetical protein